MLQLRPGPTINCQKRQGRTFYVAANGSDTNDGRSAASPWASIGKINDYAFSTGFKSGDRLLFDSRSPHSSSVGVYLDKTKSQFSLRRPLVISSYAGGSAQITITSANENGILAYQIGLNIKRLLFNNSSGYLAATKEGIYFYADADTSTVYPFQVVDCKVTNFNRGIYVSTYNQNTAYRGLIQGCIVSDCKENGIQSFAQNNNVHQLAVRHCSVSKIHGTGVTTQPQGSPIVLGMSKNSVIEFCHSDELESLGNNNASVAIWFYGSTQCVIRNNIALNGKSQGTDGGAYDADIQSSFITIENNFAYNCEGAGVLVMSGNGHIIRNNILINCGKKTNYSGILLSKFGVGDPITNIQIYNNTIHSFGLYANVPAFRYELANQSGLVANNIFSSGSTSKVVFAETVANGLTFAGNNYYASGSSALFSLGSNNLNGLSNWRVNGPREKQGAVNYGYSVDPVFVNAAGATAIDFRLQNGTLPSGIDLSSYGITLPGVDYFGNPVSPSNIAIGAHTPPGFTPAATPATTPAYGTYTSGLITRLTASYTTNELADLQTFVIAANQNGALDQLEFLYLLRWGKSQADALRNVLADNFNATVVGTVTYTSGTGIRTGASSYIRSNFNLSTGTKYLRDNSTLGFWLPAGRTGAGGNIDMGVSDGTNATLVQYRHTGSVHRYRMQSAIASTAQTFATASSKMCGARRTSATATDYIRDGSILAGASLTSTLTPSLELYIGASNNSGTAANFTSELYGAAWAGGSLTNQQYLDLYNALNTLFS
jgi:hypothetical protein